MFFMRAATRIATTTTTNYNNNNNYNSYYFYNNNYNYNNKPGLLLSVGLAVRLLMLGKI